jgi:hypothetical protein
MQYSIYSSATNIKLVHSSFSKFLITFNINPLGHLKSTILEPFSANSSATMSCSYGYLCLRIVFVYARLADLLNIITSIDFLRFFSVCFHQAHEERGSSQSLH